MRPACRETRVLLVRTTAQLQQYTWECGGAGGAVDVAAITKSAGLGALRSSGLRPTDHDIASPAAQ